MVFKVHSNPNHSMILCVKWNKKIMLLHLISYSAVSHTLLLEVNFCNRTSKHKRLVQKQGRLCCIQMMGKSPSNDRFCINTELQVFKATRECCCFGENELTSPNCSHGGKCSWTSCGFQVEKYAGVLFM